jgi:hypothetical protein
MIHAIWQENNGAMVPRNGIRQTILLPRLEIGQPRALLG